MQEYPRTCCTSEAFVMLRGAEQVVIGAVVVVVVAGRTRTLCTCNLEEIAAEEKS